MMKQHSTDGGDGAGHRCGNCDQALQAVEGLVGGAIGLNPDAFYPTLMAMKVPAKAKKDWQQMAEVLDEFIDSESGKPTAPSNMITSVIEGGYREYMWANFDNADVREQDLGRFEEFAFEFETLEQFLNELSLLTTADGLEKEKKESPQQQKQKQKENEDAVVLSTEHQAKGLEWKVVFIIGLTEGAFPTFVPSRKVGRPDWKKNDDCFMWPLPAHKINCF